DCLDPTKQLDYHKKEERVKRKLAQRCHSHPSLSQLSTINRPPSRTKAGISNMHDALNSRNPGDKINNATAIVPIRHPDVRPTIIKTLASNTAVKAVVTKRAPSRGGRCL